MKFPKRTPMGHGPVLGPKVESPKRTVRPAGPVPNSSANRAPMLLGCWSRQLPLRAGYQVEVIPRYQKRLSSKELSSTWRTVLLPGFGVAKGRGRARVALQQKSRALNVGSTSHDPGPKQVAKGNIYLCSLGFFWGGQW